VIYQFKTRHSDAKEARGYEAHGGKRGAEAWPEAKYDNGKAGTFVKQSNDNAVYCEMAHNGILKLGDGQHIFVFAGESPAFLPNAQQPASDPSQSRNIGLVKLGPNNEVLSDGPEEKGVFYSFNGAKQEQSHKGVIWHTHYGDVANEHATRVKTARLGQGKNLITWEKWTLKEYVSSWMLLVGDDGKAIGAPVQCEYDFRLPPTANFSVVDGKAVVYSGEVNELDDNCKLLRVEFAVPDGEGIKAAAAAAQKQKELDREAAAKELAERPAKLAAAAMKACEDSLMYVNMIRTNPKSFIPVVKEYMAFIKGDALWVPGASGVCLKEGAGAYEDAISALEKQQDMPPVTVPEGLLKSVTAFVNKLGASGSRSLSYAGGHGMKNEFGAWSGGYGE